MAADATPRKSVIKPPALARPRKVDKVHFVELYSGRLQGVVKPSGNNAERVYVSYFQSGTGNYYCSTNANNACTGMRGGICKHLQALMDEAVLQFGAPRVITYLGLGADPATIKRGSDLLRFIKGGQNRVEAGMVFSRFLTYLHHVSLPQTTAPIPEINWFVR